MGRALIHATELEEVWARLDLVMDPELDEPMTDMGFIEAVSISGPASRGNSRTVDVSFRLPTFWCSPNFAFLMAEGIKREIEALPWVGQAVVTLHDHMAAEEMNAAVNEGRSFASVFSELQPDQNLDALREQFDQKAFQRRQEVVIKALVALGHAPETIVDLTLAAFDAIDFPVPEDARQKGRYRALLMSKGLAHSGGDPALPTYQGARITADGYRDYMNLLRSVRINMEFSGSLCRGLKRSRYKEADLSGDMPVLVDFALPEMSTDHSR